MTALNHDDIRWRVSNTWDKGDAKMGMLVGYIDSRTAMEALDALDPNWSTKMEPVSLGGEHGIRCTLIVNGVAREDVGVASTTEPLKGAFSDALKRAAVHFGVGRELYELPKIAVECIVDKRTGKVKAPKALPTFSNGRWSIDRQYGWVKYDREPEDQPEQRRGAQASYPNVAAPVPSQYRRAELAALMKQHHLTVDAVEAIADRMGIAERPMSDESMDRLIEAIESEQAASAHAAAPSTPEGDARSPQPATDPAEADSVPPAASPQPGPAPTLDEVLAAAGPGAELVPPKPDEDPEGYRAWFESQPREVRADLRAKGRSPKRVAA